MQERSSRPGGSSEAFDLLLLPGLHLSAILLGGSAGAFGAVGGGDEILLAGLGQFLGRGQIFHELRDQRRADPFRDQTDHLHGAVHLSGMGGQRFADAHLVGRFLGFSADLHLAASACVGGFRPGLVKTDGPEPLVDPHAGRFVHGDRLRADRDAVQSPLKTGPPGAVSKIMKASLLLSAGLMLGAVAASAQTHSKIQYRTPVTEATPLGFTLVVQSRPDGGGVCYAPPSPSVIIVPSLGGSTYRGTYYARNVSYGNGNFGRLNVSGYNYNSGYGGGSSFGWTGSGHGYAGGYRGHCGVVAGQPSCGRTLAARHCDY
jgi:hypothetical protein